MIKNRSFITDFSAGELSQKMKGRFDLPAFAKGGQTVKNFLAISQGGLTKRPGTKWLGSTKSNAAARIIPFVYSEDESYIIELSASEMQIWRNVSGVPTVVASTSTPVYNATQIWEVQVAQNHRGIYFAHPSYVPNALIRTAQDIFLWGAISYLYYAGATRTSHNTSNVVGNETLVVTATITGVNQQGTLRVKYATGQADEYTYTSWDGVTFSGVSPPLARTYDNGDTVVVGHEYDSDGATTPFAGASNYPRAIAIFNGRFWFLGSNLDRQRIWASKPYSDVYDGDILTVDMRMQDILVSVRTEQTPQAEWSDATIPETEAVTYVRAVITDASGIQIDIGSDKNDSISWAVPARDLIIGTTAAEWIIPSTTTARSPSARMESRVGTSTIQPVFVWDILAYLQSANKQLRAATYSQEGGGYKPPDLTRLADHILGTGAVQMGFQQQPRCLLFFPRSDGELAVLTYEPDGGVLAWQRWVHGNGTFTSVAVIPEDGVDVVYVVALRNSKYYLEKLTDPFPSSQSDLVLMDSSYDVTADPNSIVDVSDVLTAAWLDTTQTGAEKITVFQDGLEAGTETVSSNTVDLSAYSGTQVTVGLPYEHRLETMPVQGQDAVGQMQMKDKRVATLFLRLYRSMAFKVIDDDDWTVANADAVAVGTDADVWASVDVEIPYPDARMDGDGAVRIVGEDAKPLTILAMSMEVVHG